MKKIQGDGMLCVWEEAKRRSEGIGGAREKKEEETSSERVENGQGARGKGIESDRE